MACRHLEVRADARAQDYSRGVSRAFLVGVKREVLVRRSLGGVLKRPTGPRLELDPQWCCLDSLEGEVTAGE